MKSDVVVYTKLGSLVTEMDLKETEKGYNEYDDVTNFNCDSEITLMLTAFTGLLGTCG